MLVARFLRRRINSTESVVLLPILPVFISTLLGSKVIIFNIAVVTITGR